MCLTKVYYNTYSDGAQDITEKHYPCGGGRGCAHNEVRKYDRKFPFTKLGDVKPESYRSLSERQPTPYFSSHATRGAKSPGASGSRDSGVYYDYTNDPYDGYGYHHSSSRHDPRDRHDRDRGRDRGDLRLKRSATNPQIVYVDRDGKSSSRSRSGSRDYSRDIPLGLVPLADEYGRRRHSSRSRSREGSREEADHYYRRRGRTDDPNGYVVIDDQDERRRRRREEKHRRLSTSSYTEPSSSAAAAAMAGMDGYGEPYQYMPRRASTVVHHSDGSISTSSGGAVPKQLRWEDQVRAKRERQNAEIASRAASHSSHGEVKGILKHTGDSRGKGKGRELDDIAELRRAVERMEIPRGRDREPRSARGNWEGWGGYDDYDSGRRKRSKVYADDRYRY